MNFCAQNSYNRNQLLNMTSVNKKKLVILAYYYILTYPKI